MNKPLDYHAHPVSTPGRGYRSLPVTPAGSTLEVWLPVLVVNGANPGPTLALLAGVHGDEYEGIRAIPEVLNELDVTKVSGRVLAVPICNPPAFQAATRCSPWDGLNLARVFPGDPNGSITEQIAAVLSDEIIGPANFLLDIHSAGVAYSIETMVGYPYEDTELGRVARGAAEAFGVGVVWAHPHDPSATGRTVSEASARGIPWLYTEAPGSGRVRPSDLDAFKAGVLNTMGYLGLLEHSPGPSPIPHYLYGSGNLDRPLKTAVGGYFVSQVDLLERVSAGQFLGAVLDPSGAVLQSFHADRDGVVAMIRGLPRVQPGDGVFLVTGEMEPGA